MIAPRTRPYMPMRFAFLLVTICILLLSACSGLDSSQQSTSSNAGTTSSSTASNTTSQQQITYSTGSQDVVLRTFYGGGIYGAFEAAPTISVYGDGTYIFGANREGKLNESSLQALLNTIVNTYGLLNFKRQQFSDIQDQNSTFLEVSLNGKHQEYVYGSFGNQQESAEDMDEYHRLNAILTAITSTLNGPTHLYKNDNMVLLVHQTFGPNSTGLTWPLSDFTLAQASAYECGLLPTDETSHNAETGCLKYLIPQHAILLSTSQAQILGNQLPAFQQASLPQGLYNEGEDYYIVTLRPLLPDELTKKSIAMFGSAQDSYTAVPLLNGQVPPVPTPTPST